MITWEATFEECVDNLFLKTKNVSSQNQSIQQILELVSLRLLILEFYNRACPLRHDMRLPRKTVPFIHIFFSLLFAFFFNSEIPRLNLPAQTSFVTIYLISIYLTRVFQASLLVRQTALQAHTISRSFF